MDAAAKVKLWAAEAGAAACGVAVAAPVAAEDIDAYRQWIAAGCHGSMAYLAQYDDVRADPRLLLPGARSMISCAFPYTLLTDSLIASYAMGDDYHQVIRCQLGAVADRINNEFQAQSRVCVDTAPLLERYWAVRAGIGFVGRNRQLIVPGCGSAVLLGEILTTAELASDRPCSLTCGDCMACVSRCPGGALSDDGDFDARRCLSYLTIEYRGELPPDLDLQCHLYGCDECQLCCPHNIDVSSRSVLPELQPRSGLLTLTADDVAAMDHEAYCSIFRHSAIRRAKLPQLQRNALRMLINKH